ncbi:MAG: hypothetical protein ACXWA9_03710 [Acidimicrobiia bacterium]
MDEPRAEVRRLLDGYPNTAEGERAGATPRLCLLGFDVEMHTPDAELTRYITQLYAPMRRADQAEHVLTLSRSGPAGAAGPEWAVHLDAIRVVATPAASIAFQYLLWEANRQAIESSTDFVLVHASAAVFDGMAMVLPGPMGAGKSTLAAALVREGLGYLTDEVVALDPATGLIRPYPKYLSLGGALADLVPQPPASIRAFLGDQHLVAPEAIRPGSIAAAAPPRLVVAPRYEPGAGTTLDRLTPAAALSILAQHAFHIERDAQRTLDVLGTVVDHSQCFQLVSGDVAGATATLLELVAEIAASPRASASS